jgi:lysophospholipase L1-like esterase
MSSAEIHVLFFGDSHTVGVGDPSGLGWVGRIVATTHAEGIPLVPYNLGVRGETSEDVMRRWQGEATARASDLETKVVFAVGANDAAGEEEAFPAQPIASVDALGAMLRQADEAGLPAIVVGPAPVGDEQQVERIANLSSRFAEVCEQVGVPFVEVTASLRGNGTWREEIAASDEAHPGAAGYEALARIVLESGWLSWVGPPGHSDGPAYRAARPLRGRGAPGAESGQDRVRRNSRPDAHTLDDGRQLHWGGRLFPIARCVHPVQLWGGLTGAAAFLGLLVAAIWTLHWRRWRPTKG